MTGIKNRIGPEVESLSEDLFSVSDFLLANPETAFKEFKARDYLSSFLEQRGFEVKKEVGGVETSFIALPAGCPQTRPSVALLAEYDALPEIGHGCGHNLIAAASLGAAIALRRILGDKAGGLVLVGTPAEEGGGGKALLAEAGVFEGMDAAMMFHPSSINIPGQGLLGRTKFKAEFFGRSAHASFAPDQGINALDALNLAYCSINSLRQHLRQDGRIHGIITHGGDFPSIIPSYAAGLFYVRGASQSYRDELLGKVRKCCEGAALATGCEFKLEVRPPVLDPMKRNPGLESALLGNMKELGIKIDNDDGRQGSSDMGNLSQYLPSIHPWLAIAGPEIAIHSTEFRDATTSSRGRKTMLDAAKMLAMTGYDFLNSPELRERVKRDFSGLE
jgi:amidohydrolase